MLKTKLSSVPPQRTPKQLSEVRTQAALARWDSVRQEREMWLRPFRELPLTRATSYLEDLRKICETAAGIINQRIGEDKSLMRCAGITGRSANGKGFMYCGKDLSGLRPNGMPLWINKTDVRDSEDPSIIRSLFFCSELCFNSFVRQHAGAMGGTAPSFKTV